MKISALKNENVSYVYLGCEKSGLVRRYNENEDSNRGVLDDLDQLNRQMTTKWENDRLFLDFAKFAIAGTCHPKTNNRSPAFMRTKKLLRSVPLHLSYLLAAKVPSSISF